MTNLDSKTNTSSHVKVASAAPRASSAHELRRPVYIGPVNWVGLGMLCQREVQRFLKIVTQTLGAPVATSILFLMVFSVVIGERDSFAGDIDFVTFLLPGLMMMNVLQSAFALSLGDILAGIWANKFDELAAITNFVTQPLTFLSGTFYSVDRLPSPFDTIASLNPVFYAIDGFRYGMIGVADWPLMTGFYCFVAVNVVLAILCYEALRLGYRLKS